MDSINIAKYYSRKLNNREKFCIFQLMQINMIFFTATTRKSLISINLFLG